MLTDTQQIHSLLISDGFGKKQGEFRIHDDGTVDILAGGIAIWEDHIKNGQLPFRFGTVSGYFGAHQVGLTTMLGFPRRVDGNLRIARNPGLTSWEHAPEAVGGGVDVSFCGFKDVKGIPSTGIYHMPDGSKIDVMAKIKLYGNKHLSSIAGVEKAASDVVIVEPLPNLPLLRMLALKEQLSIRIVRIGAERDTDFDDHSRQIMSILRKHWETYQTSKNKAIMAAQKDLVKAGFPGNALW